MTLDVQLFTDILNIESTSGRERRLADFLAGYLMGHGCNVTVSPQDFEAGAPANVLALWGEPKVVYCTHLDTVPPYIAPQVTKMPDGDTLITGRGACDAKGQIFAMVEACKALAERGANDFGLLLLYGEETGSFGAKSFSSGCGGEYVVVGEPTGNKMVAASKGTKAFEVRITGRAFHSGYPQYGSSAVERFVDLVNALRAVEFPEDPELGATTYNIGRLISDNPQNILSADLRCRIYFRTTFASDRMVGEVMQSLVCDDVAIDALGGDTPMRYLTLPGFETTTVSFGSDAPQLANFRHKSLCGPGSILVAHTSDEQIRLSEIRRAVEQYIEIYYRYNSLNTQTEAEK